MTLPSRRSNSVFTLILDKYRARTERKLTVVSFIMAGIVLVLMAALAQEPRHARTLLMLFAFGMAFIALLLKGRTHYRKLKEINQHIRSCRKERTEMLSLKSERMETWISQQNARRRRSRLR